MSIVVLLEILELAVQINDIPKEYLVKKTAIHPYKARSFDHLELLLFTKPSTEHKTLFNAYIHDFLFLPDSQRESGGTCTQWYPAGDQLQDRLITCLHLNYAVKQGPDHYVLELFVPRNSLVGFDPQTNTTMRGNIVVHNWQPHVRYYLSAEEHSLPKYWGLMNLVQ